MFKLYIYIAATFICSAVPVVTCQLSPMTLQLCYTSLTSNPRRNCTKFTNFWQILMRQRVNLELPLLYFLINQNQRINQRTSSDGKTFSISINAIMFQLMKKSQLESILYRTCIIHAKESNGTIVFVCLAVDKNNCTCQ